jgi:hypothetical protein
MNTRLCGALCAGMISLGVAAHSHATPVTAIFDSTIDLSGLGGAANAPFKIQYTYDNATSDFDPSNNQGGYEILSGTAQGAIVKCGVWRIKRLAVSDLHFV